jgi:hypothetical protein
MSRPSEIASKCDGKSIAQLICQRLDVPCSEERSAQRGPRLLKNGQHTKTFAVTSKCSCGHCSVEEVHEVPESLSARIVVDPTHAPLSDWRACFSVRVTSQNCP